MPTPEQLAAIHAICFQGSARWSADAFAQAMESSACFFVFRAGGADGFALGRVVADEAELLTLAVSPDRRRDGVGRALLDAFLDGARDRDATVAHLEVAADNGAALALYRGAGWDVAGRRKGYYAGIDALTLRRTL